MKNQSVFNRCFMCDLLVARVVVFIDFWFQNGVSVVHFKRLSERSLKTWKSMFRVHGSIDFKGRVDPISNTFRFNFLSVYRGASWDVFLSIFDRFWCPMECHGAPKGLQKCIKNRPVSSCAPIWCPWGPQSVGKGGPGVAFRCNFEVVGIDLGAISGPVVTCSKQHWLQER